jgi:hypothetical protein
VQAPALATLIFCLSIDVQEIVAKNLAVLDESNCSSVPQVTGLDQQVAAAAAR